MKKTILIACFTMTVITTKAQQPILQQTVIGNTANDVTVGPTYVSYTVGEPVGTTIGNANSVHLTQGFHQPEHIILDDLNEQADGALKIALYPNPASDVLWLGCEMKTPGLIVIIITDVNGQVVLQPAPINYTQGAYIQSFDVSGLSAGSYIATLQSGTTIVTSKPFIITK